jgi:hypothetical protein
MDQEVLVREFRKLATYLKKTQGGVELLLLVAPDEDTVDSWNVIVSAHGFDQKPRGEAIRELSETLRQRLSKQLWPWIARTTVLRTNDPFVLAFTRRYSSLSSGATLQAVNVAGTDIPKAVVLEASPQAA